MDDITRRKKGFTDMERGIKSNLEHYRRMKADSEARKQDGLHDYSLLASLLNPSNEVGLHSRFLCSMLNPKGLHYQGAKFLNLFVEQLPISLRGFINIERAEVVREKDHIDILIHDGERALIIENKVHALDQRYQISRYIGCAQRKLFAGERNLSGRLAVIYLSRNPTRAQPTTESRSLIGFNLADGTLTWEGTDGHSLPSSVGLPNLQIGTAIPFHHLPYFPSLVTWAQRCAETAPPGSIRYAFEEYLLILKRLREPRSWKNIMNLSSYAMILPDDEQRELYNFMVEARLMLDSFIVAKLMEGIAAIFGDEALSESGPFRPFTEDTVRAWFKQPKGKEWKDVGFVSHVPGGGQLGFVLASKYGYLGLLGEKELWANEEQHNPNRLHGGDLRSFLRTEPDAVFDLLTDIRTRARRY